jgi:hypothetical protein
MNAAALNAGMANTKFDGGSIPPVHVRNAANLVAMWAASQGHTEWTLNGFRATLEAEKAIPPPVDLNLSEAYRVQMAAISTAAMGFWHEGQGIDPSFDTPVLRDVAKLYQRMTIAEKTALAAQAEVKNLEGKTPVGEAWFEAAKEASEAAGFHGMEPAFVITSLYNEREDLRDLIRNEEGASYTQVLKDNEIIQIAISAIKKLPTQHEPQDEVLAVVHAVLKRLHDLTTGER